MEKVTHELKQLRKLAALLQSAWYHGEWKAETVNEREMETIMGERGYWPVTLSAHTFEPNLIIKGETMVREKNNNNNPGNNNTVSNLIDEHLIIRETVGYDFLNNVAIEDIPEVIKFLKIIFNYTKMNNIK